MYNVVTQLYLTKVRTRQAAAPGTSLFKSDHSKTCSLGVVTSASIGGFLMAMWYNHAKLKPTTFWSFVCYENHDLLYTGDVQ
jgi:hypothetical protein